MIIRTKIKLLSIIILLCSFTVLPGCSEETEKKALITFQLDHPFITQYTKAKALFDSKGIKGTLMVNLNEVGKSKYFMTWDQLKEMHDEGWEVGGHSTTHPNMKTLNEEEIRYELSENIAVLEARGFDNVRNYAYPYNWYDIDVIYVIPEYYRSARTSVAQTNFHINPENLRPYELSAYEARLSIDNVSDAYQYIDKAKKEGRWLIFIFHEFDNDDSIDDTLSKDVTDIRAMEMLIDYIQEKNIPIVTTDEALDYYLGQELRGP